MLGVKTPVGQHPTPDGGNPDRCPLCGQPQPDEVVPLLVTIPEAAKRLSIGRTSVYKLIDAGELEVVHPAGTSRVVYDSIVTYVARLRGLNGPMTRSNAQSAPIRYAMG